MKKLEIDEKGNDSPVTTCSLAFLRGFFLKTKSPNARDRARLPLTLLTSTQPPAASATHKSSINIQSLDKNAISKSLGLKKKSHSTVANYLKVAKFLVR